jgi:hypothetical protein
MQNLTNIISNVLRDLLPQHLVRIIAPKLVRAIEGSDCGDEEELS